MALESVTQSRTTPIEELITVKRSNFIGDLLDKIWSVISTILEFLFGSSSSSSNQQIDDMRPLQGRTTTRRRKKRQPRSEHPSSSSKKPDVTVQRKPQKTFDGAKLQTSLQKLEDANNAIEKAKKYASKLLAGISLISDMDITTVQKYAQLFKDYSPQIDQIHEDAKTKALSKQEKRILKTLDDAWIRFGEQLMERANHLGINI